MNKEKKHHPKNQTLFSPKKTNKKKEDEELDKALKDTFPASDSTAKY